MLSHKLLMKSCELSGMDYYSPNIPADSERMHFFPPVKKNLDEEVSLKYESTPSGCLGPFRRPLKITINHPVILVLRHPFDGLVSMFHSFTKIHGGIPQKHRVARLQKGIDRCVIDFSVEYHSRYKIYLESYIGKKEVVFLKYEDMWLDSSKWIASFIDPFNLSKKDSEIMKDLFTSETALENAKEGTHKNKMEPGQYRNALKDETINKLLETWKPVLHKLGYDL